MDLLRFRKSMASYVAYWGNNLDDLQVSESEGTLMATICDSLTWNVFQQDVFNILRMDEAGVDREEYMMLPIQRQLEIAQVHLRNFFIEALKKEIEYPREVGSRRAKNEIRRQIANLQ